MNEAVTKVEAERQMLAKAQARGTWAKLRAYSRLSGPGWLQSAITLGGGSLANGLYLGIFAGVGLLWVQPLAMILGIIMLSAIAYVTLSTGERPFRAINVHVNPVLGWSWVVAALLANMVWCLPQYSLASGVLQQNLLPSVVGPESPLGDFRGKLAVTIAILLVSTMITWAYEIGGWGIRLYETILKVMVGMVVICFFGVIFALSSQLHWGHIVAGFLPDVTRLYEPSADYAPLLAQVPEQLRGFWSGLIVSEQQSVLIGATATAVGINMTFLFPYSLLAKGWTREFRGLASFDLSTGMLIPFLLATSCVVIAAANQFHPRPGQELTEAARKQRQLEQERLTQAIALVQKADGDEKKLAEARKELSPEVNAMVGHLLKIEARRTSYVKKEDKDQTVEPLTQAEQELVMYLQRRDAFDLARSLAPFTGAKVANYIFGLGVLGMTLSTITILMLISGFCVCEMLGLPNKGWPHRLGCLAAATGVLGPFIWAGEARFWLAVPTSVFGMMLLPIAYWSFFLLMNQKPLLGQDMPKGGKRVFWNFLMILAAGVATGLCVMAIWISDLGPRGKYPVGFYIFGGLILLALVVHFVRTIKPVGHEGT